LAPARLWLTPGRPSLTLTVNQVDARRLGALIALFERTVGLYASLVNVNAYHQPGSRRENARRQPCSTLQRRLMAALLLAGPGRFLTCEELAAELGEGDRVETVLHILERLAANPGRGVGRRPGERPWTRGSAGTRGSSQLSAFSSAANPGRCGWSSRVMGSRYRNVPRMKRGGVGEADS